MQKLCFHRDMTYWQECWIIFGIKLKDDVLWAYINWQYSGCLGIRSNMCGGTSQHPSCDFVTWFIWNRKLLTAIFTTASHILPCAVVGLKEMSSQRELPTEDFWSSQWWRLILWSSRLYHCVVWQVTRKMEAGCSDGACWWNKTKDGQRKSLWDFWLSQWLL